MRETTSLLITLLLAVTFAAPLNAAAQKCSNKTLKGTYLFNATGRISNGDYAEAGQERFDGKGNVSVDYSIDGAISSDTGTYQLLENCYGKITYSDNETNDIFVSLDGNQIRYIINPSDSRLTPAVSGEEIRVSK